MNKISFLKDTLFDGVVKHSRTQPFNHSFKYYATYFWFDIKNFRNFILFKKNRFSLFSFFENDYGEKKKNKNCLYQNIKENSHILSKNDIHSVRILCLPRIFGYSFNPISIFVCYDKLKKAKIVVFEVSNTFNERHSYYCKILKKQNFFFFKKKLYVSPFFDVRGFYKINLQLTKGDVLVNIDYDVDKKNIFKASFYGKALNLNSKNLLKVFLRNGLQNVRITLGIYFQALKLYIKGAKYIKKPEKPNNNFTSIK